MFYFVGIVWWKILLIVIAVIAGIGLVVLLVYCALVKTGKIKVKYSGIPFNK